MFIETKLGAQEDLMEFYPGQPVYGSGELEVVRGQGDGKSKLADRLLTLEGVGSVILRSDHILVRKRDSEEWDFLKTDIMSAIMAHFDSGEATVEGEDESGEFDEEIIAQVKDLLNTRIVPAVTQSGGDVAFHSYKDGNLYLKMQGSAFSMITGITNMLRHYVPEIKAIVDHREALPRPGLQSANGVAIRDILHERINPSIAAHGGHITLVDVQDDKAYVRLEGGCQGCGMADVTLKQGVAKEIMSMVPDITEVLDVTDHAGGTNPYYQPS